MIKIPLILLLFVCVHNNFNNPFLFQFLFNICILYFYFKLRLINAVFTRNFFLGRWLKTHTNTQHIQWHHTTTTKYFRRCSAWEFANNIPCTLLLAPFWKVPCARECCVCVEKCSKHSENHLIKSYFWYLFSQIDRAHNCDVITSQ